MIRQNKSIITFILTIGQSTAEKNFNVNPLMRWLRITHKLKSLEKFCDTQMCRDTRFEKHWSKLHNYSYGFQIGCLILGRVQLFIQYISIDTIVKF